MSLLEMMAYGLPCIATPVGGIPQVICDGENGILTSVGNYDELAKKLAMLLDDPGLRQRIGFAARETIAAEFDVETNIGRLIRLYGIRYDAE